MNKRIKGGLLVFFGAASFGLLSTIVKFAYAEGYTLGEITGDTILFGNGYSVVAVLHYQIDKERR